MRILLIACFTLVLTPCSPGAVQRAEINFDYVREIAHTRAAAPYRAAPNDLPERLAALTYDDYRKLAFQPERSLWHAESLPFQLQFFARGGLFHEPVQLHEFSRTHDQVIPFERDYFQTDKIKDLGALPSSLGYAGFRVMYPLNVLEGHSEVMAFLGASYFRAIGAGQHYGLSARGLALDSGTPERTEEFPRFTEFWLGKPARDATTLTFYALLESPSVTGAYEFVVTPGPATFVDVRSTVLFRSTTALPGFAPLTSMFWYGENSGRPEGQMRPEVHDSDGLLVQFEDATPVWKPLRNPGALEITSIPQGKLARFGLIQRDRTVRNYEDLEAQYERRPSAWIEPRGIWGGGDVRLAELPATQEYGDNIVAYWTPSAPPEPMRPVDFNYRIVWSLDEPDRHKVARVVGTREGVRPGGANGRMFWIDFVDDRAAQRAPGSVKVAVDVGAGGRLEHAVVSAYPEIRGWRATLEVAPATAGKPVELRCRLSDKDGVMSETWQYQWKS